MSKFISLFLVLLTTAIISKNADTNQNLILRQRGARRCYWDGYNIECDQTKDTHPETKNSSL